MLRLQLGGGLGLLVSAAGHKMMRTFAHPRKVTTVPHNPLTCVILAAGMGTRLGLPEPKPLTPIWGASTILDQQLGHLNSTFGAQLNLTIVVGHMAQKFDFLGDSVTLLHNPRYAETNTSKSLLLALESAPPGGVLWMNGDVIFSKGVLPLCKPFIESDESFMVVNQAHTGDEEVKYTLDQTGALEQVGKQITGAVGEAVGINFVSSKHRESLRAALRECDDQDYFEAGVQAVVRSKLARFLPITVNTTDAIEVDTGIDLTEAKTRFSTQPFGS